MIDLTDPQQFAALFNKVHPDMDSLIKESQQSFKEVKEPLPAVINLGCNTEYLNNQGA